jgi:tetratricopeptide (TPR) repeat protein
MSTQVEDLVLLRVDEECANLQAEGHYLEALDYMERSLVLRRCLYGNESEEAIQACKLVVDTCNGLATAYLTQDNFQMAMELIKKAEALSEPYEFLRAVTYNNLACYYRRQNKLRTALKYLEKALQLNTASSDSVNRASTHLNLCAVLSQLGRHAVALEQAQSALILLQEQLFSQMVGPMRAGGQSPGIPELADKIAVLAIAYHNAGVEQEYLRRFDGALESYTKAAELADAHLGPDHEIARTLNTSRAAAQRQITRKPKSSGSTSMSMSMSQSMSALGAGSRPSTSPAGSFGGGGGPMGPGGGGGRPSTSGSAREVNVGNLSAGLPRPCGGVQPGGYGAGPQVTQGGQPIYSDMISPRNMGGMH